MRATFVNRWSHSTKTFDGRIAIGWIAPFADRQVCTAMAYKSCCAQKKGCKELLHTSPPVGWKRNVLVGKVANVLVGKVAEVNGFSFQVTNIHSFKKEKIQREEGRGGGGGGGGDGGNGVGSMSRNGINDADG